MSNYVGVKYLGQDEIIEEDPFPHMIEHDSFYEGRNYGPQSKISRDYMAERCAVNFDKICYRYMADPRIGGVPDEFTFLDKDVNVPEGDMHLRRTAFRKYCRVTDPEYKTGSCNIFVEDVNPHAPNSKKVLSWDGSCVGICDKFDSNSFKDDIVMDNLLKKPELNKFILDNICKISDNEKIKINHVGLQNYCDTLYFDPENQTAFSPRHKKGCTCGCEFCDNNRHLKKTYDREIEVKANLLGIEEIKNNKIKNKKRLLLSYMIIVLIISIVLCGCMIYNKIH